MHAFDWLGDVIQWLLLLVPRVIHIKSTQGAVRFTRDSAVVLRPGLHVYWPVWSSIEIVCVVRQTSNLPYQTLVTSDDIGVAVAVTVVYEIDDTLLALSATDNIADTIHDISQWAIKRVVSACSSDELRRGKTNKNHKIDSILRSKLANDLKPYGVLVKQAFISEFAKPLMLRLMGDLASN